MENNVLLRSFLLDKFASKMQRRKCIAGDTFVFQQHSAPAHHARETVHLQQEMPEFISSDLWPPNIYQQSTEENSKTRSSFN